MWNEFVLWQDTNTSSDKEESIVLESLPVKQNYSVESSRASLEMYREREKEKDKDGNGGLLASGEWNIDRWHGVTDGVKSP